MNLFLISLVLLCNKQLLTQHSFNVCQTNRSLTCTKVRMGIACSASIKGYNYISHLTKDKSQFQNSRLLHENTATQQKINNKYY